MRRRDFIIFVGSVGAGWAFPAHAQQSERMRRIGVLMSTAESDAEGKLRVQAFVDSLKTLGWMENQNVRLDYRWGAAEPVLTRRLANEIVAFKPDVILSQNTAAVPPLLEATRIIPIVFTQVTEPVEAGFVASMARPGGNITGFTSFEATMGGKWIELLKEIAPRVTRVSIVFNPDASASRGVNFLRYAADAAIPLGIEVIPSPFREPSDIENAVTKLAHEPNGGLIVLPDASTNANRNIILQLANKFLLPAAYAFPFFVKGGGLFSYGPNPIDQFQRAAGYVDRILRGATPAELPVQSPTKFELVVNIKTAKALDLAVPPSLLATADEVIE
jgi:putative ABC transport system substrate-binding protein